MKKTISYRFYLVFALFLLLNSCSEKEDYTIIESFSPRTEGGLVHMDSDRKGSDLIKYFNLATLKDENPIFYGSLNLDVANKWENQDGKTYYSLFFNDQESGLVRNIILYEYQGDKSASIVLSRLKEGEEWANFTGVVASYTLQGDAKGKSEYRDGHLVNEDGTIEIRDYVCATEWYIQCVTYAGETLCGPEAEYVCRWISPEGPPPSNSGGSGGASGGGSGGSSGSGSGTGSGTADEESADDAFVTLTGEKLRDWIKDNCTPEPYGHLLHFAAGNSFESAVLRGMGYQRNGINFNSPERVLMTGGTPAAVRPDAIAPVATTNAGVFPMGQFIEVKAYAGTLRLSTSNWQLMGEIDALRINNLNMPNNVNPALMLFTLTSTTIDSDLINYAESRNVEVYQIKVKVNSFGELDIGTAIRKTGNTLHVPLQFGHHAQLECPPGYQPDPTHPDTERTN